MHSISWSIFDQIEKWHWLADCDPKVKLFKRKPNDQWFWVTSNRSYWNIALLLCESIGAKFLRSMQSKYSTQHDSTCQHDQHLPVWARRCKTGKIIQILKRFLSSIEEIITKHRNTCLYRSISGWNIFSDGLLNYWPSQHLKQHSDDLPDWIDCIITRELCAEFIGIE